MLIDSDVLIWLTRGHAGAAAKLQSLNPWRISTVTYIELAQGCRNQRELTQVKQGLIAANTQIIPITSSICACATILIDDYALSGGLRLADALIAATAIEMSMVLLTANFKHFNVINQLKINRFDPAQ